MDAYLSRYRTGNRWKWRVVKDDKTIAKGSKAYRTEAELEADLGVVNSCVKAHVQEGSALEP